MDRYPMNPDCAYCGEPIRHHQRAAHVTCSAAVPNETQRKLDRLTEKQRAIVTMIAKGYTSREIAQIVQRSPKTIECRRFEIQKILDIHNIADLTRFAIRAGLVSAED